MKTNLPIDEIFQTQLRQYSAEVPEHLFERILEQRGRRKNKRVVPFLFFFVMSVISAITVLGVYTALQTDDVPLDSFPVPIKLAEAQDLDITAPIDLLKLDPAQITSA